MKFDMAWAAQRQSITPPLVTGIMSRIVKNEGGFSNRIYDAGGPTNYGITLNVARSFGTSFDYDDDGIVTISDLKKITPTIAMAFYAMEYFYRPNINLLPNAVWPVATDMSVNMGQGTSSLIVQRALVSLGKQVAVDGKIGPATGKSCLDACNALGNGTVINRIVDIRNAHYEKIVADDPSQSANINGWLNRSNSFRYGVQS